MPITPPQDGGGGPASPPFLSVSPSGPYNFGSVAAGQTQSIVITVTNEGDSIMSIQSIVIAGVPYSLVGLPAFPAVLRTGQSFNFTLTFSPLAAGTYNDSLTITAAPGTDNSPFTNTITGTSPTAASIAFSPAAPISLPNTVLTQTSPTTTVTLTNNGNADLTVSVISLTGGTEFTLSALPALPLVMHVGDTTTFKIAFTPLAIGLQTDTINITTTANSPSITVQANGVQITPIAIISSNMKKVVMTFMNGVTGVVQSLYLLPFDLNNASISSSMVFNGTIWDTPGYEKKLRRIEFSYENYGVAILTAKATVWRPSIGPDSFDSQTTPNKTIGTALADQSERTDYFDIQIAGEIINIEIDRISGPVSFIGFIPIFEDGGEKVESV